MRFNINAIATKNFRRLIIVGLDTADAGSSSWNQVVYGSAESNWHVVVGEKQVD
jgi:hypothetical protein